MCTNLVTPYLDPIAETEGTPAVELLPNSRFPEGLGFVVDHRIQCMAHMVGHNRMMVGACGREQTKITYSLTDKIASYGGLNINSVTTNRAEGAAGSFFLLSDIWGDTERLQKLACDFAVSPWFNPHGVRVVPEKVFDLRIIAPDRCNLLRDVLRVISAEYGINIETMVNRSFRDIRQDELNRADATTEEATAETPTRVRDMSGEYTGLISVTQMRLEIPEGTNMERLKRELQEVGPGWDFTWTPRTGGGDGTKTKTPVLARQG